MLLSPRSFRDGYPVRLDCRIPDKFSGNLCVLSFPQAVYMLVLSDIRSAQPF